MHQSNDSQKILSRSSNTSADVYTDTMTFQPDIAKQSVYNKSNISGTFEHIDQSQISTQDNQFIFQAQNNDEVRRLTAIHEVVKDEDDEDDDKQEESKLLNKESVISSPMISAADRTAGKFDLNNIVPKLDLEQLDKIKIVEEQKEDKQKKIKHASKHISFAASRFSNNKDIFS